MKAAGKILQSTGDDVILAGGKTLDSDFDLTIDAADDILLGITNVANHWNNQHIGSGGDVSANGNMTMTAGDDIRAHGTLTTTAAGDDVGHIELIASNSTIYLHDDVDADVTDDGDILLRNYTWVANGKTLRAGRDVIVGDGTADGTTLTGEGALTVEADRDITLGGAVVASASMSGDLILKADADTVDGDGDAEAGGDMTAHSTITNTANGGGSIDIYSSDMTTNLHDDVAASVDIKLHNNTWVAANKTLEAGQDVILSDDKTLTGDGNLNVYAERHITLGGPVEAAGDMYLYADYDIVGDVFVEDLDGGDMVAHGTLTTTGSDITVYGKNITVNGSVDSSGDILMGAADDITLGDDVLEDYVEAVGDIWLLADLDASGIDTVNLQLDNSALDEDGVGNVHAKSTITTTSSDIYIYGENIEVDGSVDSSGMIVMGAADNITLDAWVKSVGDMYLYADYDADAGVLGEFVENDTGLMWAKSSLETLDPGSYIEVYGKDIQIDGDVTSTQSLNK